MKHNRTRTCSFDTITLEGSLFVADILEKAALGTASLQTPADFALPRGLRLSDEYGRAFQIAQAVWDKFDKEKEFHSGREASHTRSFMTEFFRDALGYTSITELPPLTIGERTWPALKEAAPGIPLVIAPWTLSCDKADPLFSITGEASYRKSAFALAQTLLNASPEFDWAFVTNGLVIRLLHDSDSLVRPAYLEFDLSVIMREQRFPDFCALWRLFHHSRANRASFAQNTDTGMQRTVWDAWQAEGAESGTRVRDGLRLGVTRALIELGSGFLKADSPANRHLREALNAGTLTRDDFYRELLRLIYRFLFLFTLEERGLLHTQGDPEGNLSPAFRKAQSLYRSGYSMARLRDRALRASASDRYGDLWQGVQVVFRALRSGVAALDLPALGGLFAGNQCAHLDDCALSNAALLEAIRRLRWAQVAGSRSLIDYKNMDTEEFGSVYESLLELVPVVDLASRSFGFVGVDAEGGSTAGNARKTTGSYYTPDSLVQELIKSALDPVIQEKLGASSAASPRPTGPSTASPRPETGQAPLPHSGLSVSVPGPEEALLSIAVIDPACGSGHFLLAAARRLAEALATVRSDGGLRDGDYRRALREVISRCIYGVDLNPMAVELARTALWLEGFEPGKPLGFLDHHIRCGNSLVGVSSLEVLSKGIPDDAYKPLTGDDKATSSALKKRNKAEKDAAGQMGLFDEPLSKAQGELLMFHHKLDAIDSESLASIESKEALFRTLTSSASFLQARAACDVWTASFFIPKKPGEPVPTSADVRALTQGTGEGAFQQGVRERSREASAQAAFFHWPIEFPEIFHRATPGFDCVLGNPPWERIKLQEEEFFAARSPAIANARNKAERGAMIASLATSAQSLDRELFSAFESAKRIAEAASLFAHVPGSDGGRYPLTGIGDVNTYALFAELIYSLRSVNGRAGFITPSGIATDDSTKLYFGHIATKGMLASFYDFENREKLFPSVDSRFKFALQTLAPAPLADFAFFLGNTGQLADARRHFALRADEFALINPNTRTCPVFRSARDAEITKKVYTRVPVLIRDEECNPAGTVTRAGENPWGISFSRLFDMSNDSGLFRFEPASGALPLYEAKMIHQFDHRWATYAAGSPLPAAARGSLQASLGDGDDAGVRNAREDEKANPDFAVRPRYWVDSREVIARVTRLPQSLVKPWLSADAASLRAALDAFSHTPAAADHPRLSILPRAASDADLLAAFEALAREESPGWLMGWRDICRATDERTVIASVMPLAGVNHKMPLFKFSGKQPTYYFALFLSNIISISFDFVARQKIGGTSLTYHYLKQFPVLPPQAYSPADILFIVPRVLELTYCSYDMAPWARDIWNSGDGTLRAALLAASDGARGISESWIPPAAELETTPWNPARLPPFPWNPDRRATLRAQLDARYARLYGLNREELMYILDPASVMGEDYPSETFRVLKNNETRDYGEYRTMRLVLDAWDEGE
ncbi:hypothetical protein K7J14_05320 [Treponema zuelzerae]|uniref:site-specific DNA-methyltransferase (adenine-specific) n=1 Tax=Teretinema zuelzerae TaxID=156 RepID=A0AAE3EH65_9SPIR|nr:DNA methyltransferase [Teretinema zuelzerae]MCD1654120.1 hypothetical protein [Teretinema zuelzerae]